MCRADHGSGDMALVPTVVTSETETMSSGFVVVKPLGSLILDQEFTKPHAVQLLLLLQAIHRAGLCHRDVRPDNVVFVDDGVSSAASVMRHVMLIDWAFACTLGANEQYNGTLHFASSAVLDHLSRDPTALYASTRGDDLHAWARTCAALSHPKLHCALCLEFNSTPPIAASLYTDLKAFWAANLQHEHWAALAAEIDVVASSASDSAVDYSSLIPLIPVPNPVWHRRYADLAVQPE
jgi:serine/threonine protein kinase